MSAEVLQRAGGYPRPAPKGGALLGFHTRGGTVVQATLSSFRHEQRKVPKERYLKSVDSFAGFHPSHRGAAALAEEARHLAICERPKARPVDLWEIAV